MLLPRSPYCQPDHVAFLIKSVLHPNTKFNTGTDPNIDDSEDAIELISGQVEQRFRSAGYIIPFVPLPKEEWPTSQTTYLKMVTMLGSAAYLGGHILTPTGKNRRGEGGNTLQDLYEKELANIYSYDRINGVELAKSRFRALCYNNTPAQRSIADPIGPMTDTGWMGSRNKELNYGLKVLADLHFEFKKVAERYWDTNGYGNNWTMVSEILELEPWMTQ